MFQQSQFPNFMELPPEIQEAILSHNPEMLTRYRLTSKELKALSGNLYIKELCQRYPSKDEIISYINNGPYRFCLYNDSIDNDSTVKTETGVIKMPVRWITSSIYNYALLRDESKYLKTDLFKLSIFHNNNDTISNEMKEYLHINNINPHEVIHYNFTFLNYSSNILTFSEIINDIEEVKTTNLMSYARIIPIRLGCMEINPHFVKKYIFNKLKTIKRIINSPNNITELLEAYIYI